MLQLRILDEKTECAEKEEAQTLWRTEYVTKYNSPTCHQKGEPIVVLKDSKVVGCCFMVKQLIGQKYFGLDLSRTVAESADFEVSKFTITSNNQVLNRKERKIVMMLLFYGLTLVSRPTDRFLLVSKPAFHFLLTSLFNFNFDVLSKSPRLDICPQDRYWRDDPPPILLLFNRMTNQAALSANFTFLYN
jgi:hypothetical protein